MPKQHKTTSGTSSGPIPSESENVNCVQPKKIVQPSKSSRKTKWNPFPVEIRTLSSKNASSSQNHQKTGRNRQRRKGKSSGNARCRKPASPSLVSTCSSNSITSDLGSSIKSDMTILNEIHDVIPTPTSSGCSSIGFNEDKYEDDSEIAAEEKSESVIGISNDLAAVSVEFITETEDFVKPDFSNPSVQQFYREQRIIYRRFYERQFSAMACIPYTIFDATTYLALTSKFNHCNIQANRPNHSAKPNINGSKSVYDQHQHQHRKSRSNRSTNYMKTRISYNSSNCLDNHQKFRDPKSFSNAPEISSYDQKERQSTEPSCSEKYFQNGRRHHFPIYLVWISDGENVKEDSINSSNKVCSQYPNS